MSNEESHVSRVVGYQSWRDLVFLHWDLPPELVRPVVPPPLDVQLRDGRAWVGIVAFRIARLRPRPLPLELRFLETNLRTYVTYNGEPAILFLALDAASRLAVAGARLGYGLPYHHARMSAEPGRYAHERDAGGAHLDVGYTVGEAMGNAEPGSLEEFLVERYRFFTVRGGRVLATEVRHPPYPLHRAGVTGVEESLFAAAGLPPAAGTPVAHFSPGVDVELLATRRA